MSEGSLSANLRAYVQKWYQAELQGESAQLDEAHLDHCGMVNAEVVQRKIVFLPGEICSTYAPTLLGALHVVMHAVIEQKSADGVVVESNIDEAKA